MSNARVRLRLSTDKVLREISLPIGTDSSERSEAASDMIRVFNCYKTGLGFAAPQVGISKRVIITRNKKNGALTIMYNPKILCKSLLVRNSNEACLSFSHRYIVKRHFWIVLLYEDIDCKKHVRFCPYKKSRVIEHEVDHLDGICIDKGRMVK